MYWLPFLFPVFEFLYMLNILTELYLDLPTYVTEAVRKQTATHALEKNYLSNIFIMQIAVFWYVRKCRESKKCLRHQLLQPLFFMKAYGEAETIGPLGLHLDTIRFELSALRHGR